MTATIHRLNVMPVVDIATGFRSRRLIEAAEIARLSRLIWHGRLAGNDVSRLIELRAIHKAAHMKFHAAEIARAGR